MTIRQLVTRALGLASLRALRGAITVSRDDPEAIREAVTELLEAMQWKNGFEVDDVISAIFTTTPDLRAAFPAETARRIGWQHVPLLCATEIPVPGGMPRCLRVLLHVEWKWWDRQPQHVYLRDAVRLRPDLPAGNDRTLLDRVDLVVHSLQRASVRRLAGSGSASRQ